MKQDRTELEDAEIGQRSATKGLLAGLIGGILATAAKSVAERAFPPTTQGEPGTPEMLAGNLTEDFGAPALTSTETAAAARTIHWGFGATVGALYGVVVEYFPEASDKDGASFGMALAALTQEGTLPIPGLAAAVTDQTPREQSSEMVSHMVFGVVTETVRRLVRKIL